MADDRRTQPSLDDAHAFLESVPDDRRRSDALAVVELMRQVTGESPVMWGSSIVGFGNQQYTTADGKQHDWFVLGLSPRKAALTFYGLTQYGSNGDLLDQLGPHSTGKGCVYVKRLEQVDRGVLIELIRRNWQAVASGDHQPEVP